VPGKDIFLSYASEDRDRIQPLVCALEGTGWTVFWDRTIPAGKTWRQVVGKELEGCRSLVVVWSSVSVEKDWVIEEAERGKARGILVPVRMDEVLPPLGFGSIQAADLVRWDGTPMASSFQAFVRDIGDLIGAPPSRTPPSERGSLTAVSPPVTEEGVEVPTRRPSDAASSFHRWRVYLSYAGVDDAEGWVERFRSQLSVRLDQLCGRMGEVEIWLGRQIDPARPHMEAIREALMKSDVFLALCSNGYLRSSHCQREFDTFRQRFGDVGLRVGDRSRLVRVRLHNIPIDQLPGASDRMASFDFFTTDGLDEIGTILNADSAEFQDRMWRLAKSVFELLRTLRDGTTITQRS